MLSFFLGHIIVYKEGFVDTKNFTFTPISKKLILF